MLIPANVPVYICVTAGNMTTVKSVHYLRVNDLNERNTSENNMGDGVK